jgi:hypothetical protein
MCASDGTGKCVPRFGKVSYYKKPTEKTEEEKRGQY